MLIKFSWFVNLRNAMSRENTGNGLLKSGPVSSKSLRFSKPLLPPIVSNTDKLALDEVGKFIHEERRKVNCEENIFDEKRFAIYSSALDQVIDHSSAYKDLLADIKREYEECISLIKNGQKEATFMSRKAKALASLPTTIAGYSKRKMELEEKLRILNSANEGLENNLRKIRGSEELRKKEEQESKTPVQTLLESKEEHRPIPGLTVEQWTDAETLKNALFKLDSTLEDLKRLQKNNYVTIEQKERGEELLKERISTHEVLLKEVKSLHGENQRVKVAYDALIAYRKKKAENPRFKLTLGRHIIGKLNTQLRRDRQMLAANLETELPQDDDDPSMEKEAELILEYIDRFNELFSDEKYDLAAVHAANSPRGVLRNAETLNRFRDVSDNCTLTPSPLLLYACALMNSSTAQSHVLDEQMSLVCVLCALRENRPDLVKHWIVTDSITPSSDIAHSLAAYGKNFPAYKSSCMVTAHKVFSEVGDHQDACLMLFHLHRYKALVDYATETAEFTKNEYFDLIKSCPDGRLIVCLCRPYSQFEATTGREKKINKVLPLRFDQALCAMIDSEYAETEKISEFLIGLQKGTWVAHITGYKLRPDDTLNKIVYEETDGNPTDDDKDADWLRVMTYSEDNDMPVVAIDIKAAMEVKKAITSSVIALGQAGKEEFDYYT